LETSRIHPDGPILVYDWDAAWNKAGPDVPLSETWDNAWYNRLAVVSGSAGGASTEIFWTDTSRTVNHASSVAAGGWSVETLAGAPYHDVVAARGTVERVRSCGPVTYVAAQAMNFNSALSAKVYINFNYNDQGWSGWRNLGGDFPGPA